MPKVKADHAGFRNGDLFCYNCGESFHIPMPQRISFYAGVLREFDKAHRSCPKTWEPPVVDQSLTETSKAFWWFDKKNGEHGESSMAMYRVMMGLSVSEDPGYINHRNIGLPHPTDPDDFRRCYLLLKTVPEWKIKLPFMKNVSPVWSKLVERWDDLTALLEHGLSVRGLKDKKSKESYTLAGKKMNELMKECGC